MRNLINVKLKTDLTKYLSGLVVGTVGYTVGKYGVWSRSDDNFIGVNFLNIGILDVAWNSLEIIDSNYQEELLAVNKKKFDDLKTANNIVKYIGKNGGFKYLHYEYICDGITHNCGNSFKKESEEFLAYFKTIGKEIKVKLFEENTY